MRFDFCNSKATVGEGRGGILDCRAVIMFLLDAVGTGAVCCVCL